MSYFFDAGRAQVAGGDVDDAVRQVERLHELLLDREQAVVLLVRAVGLAVDEELDLVELVHAEHPARVLARGARLAAEARREGRVAERQLLQDLAHVQAGERDLRRAGQVEIVALERVDVRLSVGKKPVPYIASSRTSTGGSIGTWPCAAPRSSAKR